MKKKLIFLYVLLFVFFGLSLYGTSLWSQAEASYMTRTFAEELNAMNEGDDYPEAYKLARTGFFMSLIEGDRTTLEIIRSDPSAFFTAVGLCILGAVGFIVVIRLLIEPTRQTVDSMASKKS